MTSPLAQLRAALEAFDREGRFTEGDYAALRAVLAGSLHRGRAAVGDLLDGLANLFFERHLMHDARRAELLALDDEGFGRAVRHRFRQLVADEHDDHRPYHALRAHVREVLEALPAPQDEELAWPTSVRDRGAFSRALVEQAVSALWGEQRRKPTAAEATSELFARYVRPLSSAGEFTMSQGAPEVLGRRLEGQRLATGILELLTAEEKDLLRHVLADEGSVEDWAGQRGCSRATAYRLMARLKALCRLEFEQRSSGTQLAALRALGAKLGSD
jgi:AraC-like DNA-binding protein